MDIYDQVKPDTKMKVGPIQAKTKQLKYIPSQTKTIAIYRFAIVFVYILFRIDHFPNHFRKSTGTCV